MKKKILRYSKKSSVLDVSIKYGGEIIRFNLGNELKIDEGRINDELMEQPSYYGFLTLLNNRLERVENDKKAELSKISSKLLIEFKQEKDPTTGRGYSNEVAKALVENQKEYQEALEDYHKAKENKGIISSCVESFNQRSYLLQTLSANVRREKEHS